MWWRIAWGLAVWALVVSPSSAPAQGGKDTLSVDLPGEPATLDPHLQWDTDSYHVYRNIFDNLVTRDPDGKIVPQIAKAWRYDDDTVLEFDLRTDVKFHDGTPLTVEDVVFSVRRIIDPAFKSPQLSQFDQIVKAEAAGPDRVRLTTKTPYPVLLAQLVKLSHRAPGLRREGRRPELQPRADGQRPLPARELAEGRADDARRQRRLLARQAAVQDGDVPRRAGRRRPGSPTCRRAGPTSSASSARTRP